jgi:[acyl-carrier-protein] S-malonyltransferase
MEIVNNTDGPVAALFDGQGIFEAGMGEAACRRFAAAREIFRESSEAVGIDLARVCFGDLTHFQDDSRIIQPAIIAVDLAEYAAWCEINESEADILSGLSLGIYAAMSAAHVFESPAAAVSAVAKRAKLMHEVEVATKNPGKMAGVVGVVLHELEPIVHRVGAEIAVIRDRNRNSFVVVGEDEQVDEIERHARENGARKWEILKIFGRFHSKIHQESSIAFKQDLDGFKLNDPSRRILGNDGNFINTADQAVEHAVAQMKETADWDAVCNVLALEGLSKTIEFGPDSNRGLSLQMKKGFKIPEELFLSSRRTPLQNG